MAKEPKIEQPTQDEQKEYVSLRDNDATIVPILGTNKKYKLRWMKNGQIWKLSRVILRVDGKVGEEKGNVMEQVLADNKLACKVAAIYLLDGWLKMKLLYWLAWRWFYYVKDYGADQLHPLLEEGKKKVPLMQFLGATMSLIGARDTLMQMRTEEAERILQELSTAQPSDGQKSGNG